MTVVHVNSSTQIEQQLALLTYIVLLANCRPDVHTLLIHHIRLFIDIPQS